MGHFVTRHILAIHSTNDRARAMRYIDQAPLGTRLEFKTAKRSLPQNDRMWAMLTDIAAQKEHNGRKYTPNIWKTIFVHAWKKEIRMIPSLDGQGVIPLWGTSDLSKEEMSELIAFMESWGAENGVTFHDHP